MFRIFPEALYALGLIQYASEIQVPLETRAARDKI